MAIIPFDDHAPGGSEVTAYDERHHRTYWRLLDAAEEQADWREVVHIVFGLDPDAEPNRARIVYESHLARAHWMCETGYRHYLKPDS